MYKSPYLATLLFESFELVASYSWQHEQSEVDNMTHLPRCHIEN